MEIRIGKNEFLRGLRIAQGIADRKSTMPMLANVLLRTQGKNQLLVAATDLNVSLSAELKSQNTAEGGITLNAKSLNELIASAPGDDITLKRADNHWAEIRSGKVTYRIVGMPDRDFPSVPDHREATYTPVESAVLREMIDRTLFSVCNDETRFHLNGVFFESDGSRRAWSRPTGIDSARSSERSRTGPSSRRAIIIPKKGLLEMKKVLESGPSCKLAIKTPHLFLVQEDLAHRGQAHRCAVSAVRAGHPEGPQEGHHDRPRALHRCDATSAADVVGDARREGRGVERGRHHRERQPGPRRGPRGARCRVQRRSDRRSASTRSTSSSCSGR